MTPQVSPFPATERRRTGSNSSRQSFRFFLSFFLLTLIFCSSSALGQDTRGVISGRVLDPSSAPVAGARVTVTNTATNAVTRLSTNQTGYYEANLLIAGTYRIAVEVDGFKRAVRDGIELAAGAHLEVDVALELGSLTETVSVSGQAPLLEAGTVAAGRTIDTRSLLDLPLPGGNVVTLSKLAPGIQTIDSLSDKTVRLHSNGAGSRYSVGGNVGGNEYSVDGTPDSGNGRNIAYMPAPEIVQELRVETGAFEASMGHSTGVNVAMMTKAGTNSLHGALRETHRQSRWEAMPFFTKQAYYTRIAQAEAAGNKALADEYRSQPGMPAGRDNSFAATVGGPVVLPKIWNGKDRLFFFFGYTGFRVGQYRTSYETVPTAANREGDFSQLLNVDSRRYQIYDPLSVRPDPARPSHYIRQPFSGNIVPKSRIINPAYKFFSTMLPGANNSPADPKAEPSRNHITYASPYQEKYDAYANRIDFRISDTHRVFSRWSWNSWNNSNPGWLWDSPYRERFDTGDRRKNAGISADWVWTLGAGTVLDVAAAANQYMNTAYIRNRSTPSDTGLPAYLDEKAGAVAVIPTMSWSGYTSYSNNFPTTDRYRTLAGKADLFHIRGNHTVRAGVDLRGHFRVGFSPGIASGSFGFSSNYTKPYDDNYGYSPGSLGLSWAAFMLGIPDSMSIDSNDSWALANPYIGWYVQDSWRVTRKLTVNFGLRIEHELGLRERFQRAVATFDPNAQLPITAAAQAAYAGSPVPELPASQFTVKGGSVYASQTANGRLWENSVAWLPRLSVAYRLNPTTVLSAGYGLFVDTLNALNQTSLDQTGFSRRTTNVPTTDYGMTWLIGNPLAGVSPLADPFPVRADGSRYDKAVRDAFGAMAKVGRGSWTAQPFNRDHARQQRVRAGLQKQFGNETVISAAYSGYFADRIQVTQVLSALPGQYWAGGNVRNDAIAGNMNANVPNPFYIGNFEALKTSHPALYQDMANNSFFTSRTIRKNSLLRPFPQMNGISMSMPLGEVRTHSLELSVERRFAKGFNLNASYTRMKARETYFLNEFDSELSWRESNNARPHRFTATSLYQLPFGKGRRYATSGFLSHLVGGLQISLIYEWQPGALIEWPNLFYYGDLGKITEGERTFGRWFNIDAGFERNSSKVPAGYHRRVFPTRLEGVRADMLNNWNGSIQRDFQIREGMSLQIRADLMNLQNRSQFDAPETNPLSGNFGKVLSQPALSGSGGGAVNRWMQLQARFSF